MPGIGLDFVKNFEDFEKQNNFVWMVKPMAACKVFNGILYTDGGMVKSM